MNDFFGLPTELLTPEYSQYSNQSKLLFAIVISEAENTRALKDLAEIIQKIGDKKLSLYIRELHKPTEQSEV